MGVRVAEDLRERLWPRVRACYARSFRAIAIDERHVDRMTDDALNEARSREHLSLVEEAIGRPLRGLRALELGSGYGLTLALAIREFGADAYGLEPGDAEFEGTLEISVDLLRGCGVGRSVVVSAVGERLPFADDAFDLVYSSNVLEHVADPRRVLDESLRVLRPGGYLHVVVPNYGSWWEGHYGVPWFPNLPRRLGKLYVRLLGRDPAFLDTLQLVNPRQLRAILRRHHGRADALDWGVALWERRLRTLAFAEWAALARLKRLVRVLHRLRLVEPLIAVGRRLGWQTPIALTVRRTV